MTCEITEPHAPHTGCEGIAPEDKSWPPAGMETK